MSKVAVVGLGYVGLPLAVGFAKHHEVIGFDLNPNRLVSCRLGQDTNGDLDSSQMLSVKDNIIYTNDESLLFDAEIIVVAVPTPITEAKIPDLTPLISASEVVGRNLSSGTVIVYESTVYPGCTEEICIPILERESGLKWGMHPDESGQVFFVGYSPERINPGDKVHRLENITKIVSGDTPVTLEIVAELYESVVTVGVHRASSIKVAEAAKVIENTQRDLNIALVNELSMIFHKLGIDTLEVLEAAGTKWNFLPFRPGTVSGHCIGVDPYYLTYKAQSIGFNPQVILAGRRTNDGMGKFIAEQTIKQMIAQGLQINGSDVIIFGITFKENVPDIRNTRIIDIIEELEAYNVKVHVCDPVADPKAVRHEYGIELVTFDRLPVSDAVIYAVTHDEFADHLDPQTFAMILKQDGVIIDVKSALNPLYYKKYNLWRL